MYNSLLIQSKKLKLNLKQIESLNSQLLVKTIIQVNHLINLVEN